MSVKDSNDGMFQNLDSDKFIILSGITLKALKTYGRH